jgi:hypothetical protein
VFGLGWMLRACALKLGWRLRASVFGLSWMLRAWVCLGVHVRGPGGNIDLNMHRAVPTKDHTTCTLGSEICGFKNEV